MNKMLQKQHQLFQNISDCIKLSKLIKVRLKYTNGNNVEDKTSTYEGKASRKNEVLPIVYI